MELNPTPFPPKQQKQKKHCLTNKSLMQVILDIYFKRNLFIIGQVNPLETMNSS